MNSKVVKAAKGLAGFTAITGLAWLGMAWGSGTFLSREGRWAADTVVNDGFAHQKKYIEVGGVRVAYIDVGQGPPLILLHGCPFSAHEWREIIPILARTHRVIAPDLIGLGDTPVTLDQDYRLPEDVRMVTGLMDALNIPSADFIGHDHGGATVQLMMNSAPERLNRVILTNVEAYDQWPSKPELPYLRGIVNPVTGPLLYYAFRMDWLQRQAFGVAFHEPDKVSQQTYAAFTMQHASTPERWQRLRRFFAWQLDPVHNNITMTAIPGMRRFTRPVLLLWGAKDENFGPAIARRLVRDIPGAVGIGWMQQSAHMPMLEEPEAYAAAAEVFLTDQPPTGLGANFETAQVIRARQ